MAWEVLVLWRHAQILLYPAWPGSSGQRESLPGKNPILSPGSAIAKNNPVFRRRLKAAEGLERHLVSLLGFLLFLPHIVEIVPMGSAWVTGEL